MPKLRADVSIVSDAVTYAMNRPEQSPVPTATLGRIESAAEGERTLSTPEVKACAELLYWAANGIDASGGHPDFVGRFRRAGVEIETALAQLEWATGGDDA